MSLILGALLACAAGLAGIVLCPDDSTRRSRLPLLAAFLLGGLAWHAPARAAEPLRGPARVLDGGTVMVGARSRGAGLRGRRSGLGPAAADRSRISGDRHRLGMVGAAAAKAGSRSSRAEARTSPMAAPRSARMVSR
jgi:hypothetical protein